MLSKQTEASYSVPSGAFCSPMAFFKIWCYNKKDFSQRGKTMHELSITQSILDISVKAALEQGASRIKAIKLRMGPFSGVVPECVQMYLDVLAKGTIAEGAVVIPRTVPLKVCCNG